MATNKTKIFLLLCSCMILLSSTVQAASVAREIKEGNRLYKQGKYDRALEKYQAAIEASPDSDIANFNLGAALYKNKQYQESIEAFTRALNTEDPTIEADAVYNIANAKYKLGSQLINTDLNTAVNLYREALDYYKRAIELNENNNDAKYNHELVERELKVLLNKLKNQPPPQQQRPRDKSQNKDKQEEQQPQTGPGEGDKKEQQLASKENIDDKPGENVKPQQNIIQYKNETQKMSPEEARMLLETFGKEEALEMLQKGKKGYYPEVLKDW
jgi:tetratricopeptide (TPR) repeat protein